MNARLATLLLTVPLAWSCAFGAGRPGAVATPHQDPNIVTLEEMAGVEAANLFEAVRALRPEWLTPECEQSFGGCDPVVYLDHTRTGAPDVLRQLSVTSARELRHYGLHEAQAEFGLSASASVIQVLSRRGR